MAGPLTWRNVDSPDFRGAARGYEASAALLGNAFDSASKGLAAFDKDRKDAADTGVLSGLLKINDPKAYQDAVNNTDLTGVSKEGLAAIGSRAGQLLQQAATGQRMQFDQYDQGRKVLTDNRNDAAIPGVSKYLQATAIGDGETAQNLLEGDAGINGLDIDAQQKLVSSGRAGDAGFRSGRDSDEKYFNDKQDRAEDRLALSVGANVRSNNRRGDFAAQSGDLDAVDPLVRAKAIQKLGYDPYAAGTATTGASRGAGGGNGAAASIGAVADSGFAGSIPFNETRQYVANITSKAGDVTGTNEEKAAKLLPFLINQESGGDNSAVSPRGARGLTQVMPATGTDPGYGVKPLQNQSPEEFKRFGNDYLKAMLDKYDGDVPKALAAYNAGPGTVDQWTAGPRGQSRQFGENATDVAAPPISTAQVLAGQTVVDQRLAEGRANNASANLGANFNSTDPAGTVVQNLIKENPTFEPRAVLDQITQIKAKAPGMTDAQAADIIRASTTPTSSLNPFSRYFSDTTNLGGDVGVNEQTRDARIDEYNKGVTTQQYVNNEMVKATSAGLASAKKAADQASADFNAFVAEMKARPNSAGLARQLPAMKEKRDTALQKLQDMMENATTVKDSAVIGAVSPERRNQDLNTVPDPKSQRPSYRLADLRFGPRPE